MHSNCELAPNSIPLGFLSFGALAEFERALTQEFDAAKRDEIAEAFRVTRETANQTSIFFANRSYGDSALNYLKLSALLPLRLAEPQARR